MNTNCTSRLLRECLNLSIQEVADATELSFRTVLRAEQGAPLNPESRRRLCQFYGKTSEELGLVPRRRQKDDEQASLHNAEGGRREAMEQNNRRDSSCLRCQRLAVR